MIKGDKTTLSFIKAEDLTNHGLPFIKTKIAV